MAEIIFAMS